MASDSRMRWDRGAIILIVASHVVALAWLALAESPTWHEPAQLTAGLCEWSFGRSDMIRVNPPLVRWWAAAPVVLLHPTLNAVEFDQPPNGRDEFVRAERFVSDNAAHFCQYLTLARWVCILFSFVGAFFCWRMATMFFGRYAGLVALVLWCSCPYILGHGATIMADVPAAAMGLATVYCFQRWLKSPQWLEAIAVGLVWGLAELCKFTLLVLYLVLPVLWAIYRLPERKMMSIRDWLQQSGMLTTMLLVSVCIINCGYRFEGTFAPLEAFRFQTEMFAGRGPPKDTLPEGANQFTGTWLGRLPVPLPASFVQGIDTQRYDFEQGLPSYLRGAWADHGWWYYYLYALLIKMPLGTWVLVALAIGVTIFAKAYSASWRDEMVVVVPGLVILVFVSSQTGFSIHSRYVIPALPFLFVWMSKLARVFDMRPFTRKRMAMATMVSLALTWSVGSGLAVYPHSLSYFNELAAVLPTLVDSSYPKAVDTSDENCNILSTIKDAIIAGPLNGPRHLLNSNIDWGQDLFYLEEWYESHPEARPIRVAYFGSYPLDQSKIKSVGRPPIGPNRKQIDDKTDPTALGPLPGWYALSANEIYSRSQQYRYFLHFEPVAMAGYSIYIYHITIDEANRVRRQLGLPELRTDGGKGKAEGGDG